MNGHYKGFAGNCKAAMLILAIHSKPLLKNEAVVSGYRFSDTAI
jgi:hypothetical protein